VAAAIILAVGIGTVAIAPGEVLSILAARVGLALPWPFTEQQETVLTAIRIPRVLATALVGAAWAVAGVAMQGLYRTPLADPALVGIGAGAALGGAVGARAAVALGTVAQPPGAVLVAVVATLGAGLAAAVVHRVAAASGRVVVSTMLLGGLVLSAFLAAATALVVAAGGVPELGSATFWALGSFAGVVGVDVVLAGLVVLPVVAVLWRLGPSLDALALGETEAGHLGIDVRRLTVVISLLLALLTGVAVAVAGVIAFVGLLVPSLARALIGRPHRVVAVGSALLGASLLVLADVLARNLFSPVELSIGVLTTLVGAPFFLWLLVRDRGLVAR
jgi:iron complex transport system permease protein